MRGEQNYYSSDINWKQGSPPLARGTGLATGETDFIRRITPACAGNRLGFGIAGTAIRDHPRLRGEQNLHGRKSQIRLGSPPLARGTAMEWALVAMGMGITPACAGNRLKKDLLYLVFYNIVFHFSISFS